MKVLQASIRVPDNYMNPLNRNHRHITHRGNSMIDLNGVEHLSHTHMNSSAINNLNPRSSNKRNMDNRLCRHLALERRLHSQGILQHHTHRKRNFKAWPSEARRRINIPFHHQLSILWEHCKYHLLQAIRNMRRSQATCRLHQSQLRPITKSKTSSSTVSNKCSQTCSSETIRRIEATP